MNCESSSLRCEISRHRTKKISAGKPPDPPLTDGVITLRLPTTDDVQRFAHYGSDDALLEGIWILGPRDTDVGEWATTLVSELLAGWTEAGGDHGGGLVIDESEPCVGTVDFLPRGPRVVELNYGIAPPWRGRGIATRATSLAGEWAITEGEFDRVELRIDEDHGASRRVAEKAGFECVERFETYVEGTGLTHIGCLYVRTRLGAGGTAGQRDPRKRCTGSSVLRTAALSWHHNLSIHHRQRGSNNRECSQQ